MYHGHWTFLVLILDLIMFSLKKLSHLQHLILLCNDIKYCLVKLKTIINGPVDSVDNVDEYSEINLKKKK